MQEEISTRIADKSGVENCVGFIDGTHIRLSCIPRGDNDYVNRKGYPSVQLQLVVDDTLTITDSYVGWPGCSHDARVFRNSPIHRQLSNNQFIQNNKFIIGAEIKFLFYISLSTGCGCKSYQTITTLPHRTPVLVYSRKLNRE